MLDGKFKVVKLMVIILNIYIRKKGRWRKKKKKRESSGESSYKSRELSKGRIS